MARPTRNGVDYFPLDVNLDSKFKFIEIKFGLEGFALIIKLFQAIYAAGYWLEFNEDERLLFSYEVNVDINRVNAVILEAIARNIFDKELYDKYEILTSVGIQRRYKEITKRRKELEVIDEYVLLDGGFGANANIKSINVCNNSINVDIMQTPCKHDVYKSTQSKVKESKVKESNSIYGQNDPDVDPIIDPANDLTIKANNISVYEYAFEVFYQAYPRKVKKQETLKWFKKNKPNDELLTKMLDALEKFKRTNDWIKENGKYIPHPITWLNQKRWEDDIETEMMSQQEKRFQQTLADLERLGND